MHRLVMVHGVCWGIGQSTLSRRLAEAMPDGDVLWEDELSQPAIFTRTEFAEVADRFHRHNARPLAGIGHPPPRMLEAAYRRLVDQALEHDRTTLLAWSVMDLAEDLDWARADERALHDHARATHDLFAPLDAVLVYLDGDLRIAFDRAVEQRGRRWFTGDGGGHAATAQEQPWDELAERLLADMAIAMGRVQRAFEAGGWFDRAIIIDATTHDEDAVFQDVAARLQLPSLRGSGGIT